MVPTPPTSTPHPTVVPAPPTFTAHPTVVPAPPTFTPNPIVVPAPPISTPQPSHQGPSPVVEEFSTRLSQVRSEQGSCAEASEHNDEEDVIRTQCWVDVVGGKNKGRLYGTGELGKGYTTGRGIHKQQASYSRNAEEVVNRLTQRLEERDQAYENLTRQFQNFQNLVMAFLPPDVQTRLQQQQSNPTPPQQQPIPSKLTQVVRVAGGLSLWHDNGLRCLKVNLVCGRVKPIDNGSAE
ncbi:hypothetical protein DEO72_LG2g2704 [Vigna unguiculata]|uniref:Uncharacterized protein n=1 Tax=Vigna unguiculata TaxID=3917 RepID=A0A4D6L1K7_VIGUN|nr:hypothetical protein DEO72_LG2g2704 [Vigna unguiculata]